MTKHYEYHLNYVSKPENAAKRRAHEACKYALKTGRLIRLPCEECGAEPAQAHHDDYSKPLEVRWLCRFHHDAHHIAERAKLPRRLSMVPRRASCKRGHPFTPENTFIQPHRGPECRACRNWRDRVRYHEKRNGGRP